MKRLLYSCLALLVLCLNHTLKAQTPQYSITPNPICYNSTGIYQSTAAIVSPVTGATSYTWSVIAASVGCNPTFTPYTTGSVPNATWDAVAITIPCCGNYTVTCQGWNGLTFIASATISTFQSGGQTSGVIYCPSGSATISPSQAICAGSNATITGGMSTPLPANSFTWSNGFVGNPLVVGPSVNSCYTFTATTPNGCTVTPAAASCVSVQAITSAFNPTAQSMCPGSPINFTATASVLTGANYAPGTAITGYQWLGPAGSIGSTSVASAIAPPAPAQYTGVVTFTGAAGTCTVSGLSNFTPTTSIPVTLSQSSPSVCPNAAVTLTAVSIQTTTATNFTWITSNGVTTSTSGLNNNPHSMTVIDPPWTVTVLVNYFGCPGTATTTIGLLTLTPTLTASAPQSCPGQSLSLTANGGINYTFTSIPNPGGSTLVIPNAPSTNSVVVTTPTAGQFPIQYCVSAYSTGCTGTTCIVVTQKVLTPTITASTVPPNTGSICPGTQFTLTTGGFNSGVQAPGVTYTWSTAFTSVISNTNPMVYTPVGSNTILPLTYTVTVDSLGCTGTATFTVRKLVLNPILTTKTPSICPGTTVNLTSTGGAGTNYTFTSSQAGFPAVSPTATLISMPSGTVVYQSPGSFTVINFSVSVDSAGCKGTGTHSIGVLDLGPTLTLTPNPLSASVCPGSTVVIKAQGAINYTFVAPSPTGTFFTGSSVLNLKSDTVTSSPVAVPGSIPLSGLTYTVKGDSLGCVGTKTLLISEFKLHPAIVSSPTLVCAGMPATITATGVQSALSSPTQYTFGTLLPTVGTLSPAGTASYIVVNPTVQTVYSVLVDSMGCTGVVPPPTTTVYIRPGLHLLPSTSNASVCPGLIATLSVVAPTTALSYTYAWSQITGTGQITPVNSSSITVHPTSNSTYSIHVTDSLGCVGDTLLAVGIDPSISYSITLSSSGSTICPSQTVSLAASSTVALNNNSIGTINYSWTPATALSGTLNSPVIASPTITTIYTVTSDNGYGCFAQNTISVPVGSVPNPFVASTASAVCVGFTSTLTAFGGQTYTWTGTTFTGAIAQQSISVPSGNYTVLASNGGGCTNTAFFTVGTMNNLTITVGVTPGTATTCIANNYPKFSKPVHLSASGAGSYVWFPYNPLYMTYSLGPQTDVRPPATTQYTVIGSTAICSGTAVIPVSVIPQFSVNVVPSLPIICIGDSIKLSIMNVGSPAVGPAFSYSWTEAANAPPLSISDYFASSVTVWPLNTTTYTTEVADTRSCVSFPRLVTVTVLPQPLTSVAIPTINNVPTNTVCFVGLNPGAPDVTIDLTAINNNTGLQFGVVPTYTWLSPYVPTSILSPANANVVTVSAPTRVLNGSAVVVYTVVSGYNGVPGCRRMDTVSVRAVDCRPIRTVKFTTSEPIDTICTKSCITFVSLTDTMAGGPQTYNWQFNGGAPATSTLANPTVCYNFPSLGKPNGYEVILKVSNPYPLVNPDGGPGGSDHSFGQNLVKVVDIPNVTIVAPGQVRSDTTVRFGQSVNLHGSGALTYEWSPAYNISSLTRPNVTVNPFVTTQYILTGYNSKHCSSSDTINVIVISDCGEMYVPNAFTPNNDGANDVLYVRGICLQSLTFMIFDRWGEKVFETADQNIGWDGTYKGEQMNTAVFVYRLEGKTYDGKAFSLKGNITLIR